MIYHFNNNEKSRGTSVLLPSFLKLNDMTTKISGMEPKFGYSYLLEMYQDNVFMYYLHEYPNEQKRYKSIIRTDDTRPGCRVRRSPRGILYFIDNAPPPNMRVYNDAFQIVQHNEQLATYDLAIDYIVAHMGGGKTAKIMSLPAPKKEKSIPINIITKTKEFTEENNPLKHLHLDSNTLNNDPEIHLVGSYYTNTRTDRELEKNRFHNPDKVTTLAYKFPNGTTKLYFIDKPKDKLKWWSNCTDEIFNDCYYNDFDNSHLVITKSKLDALILYKVFGVQAIGKQQEYGTLDRDITRFKHKYVLYDNDKTGVTEGIKLAETLKANFINLPAGNDCKDLIQKDFKLLKTFINDLRQGKW